MNTYGLTIVEFRGNTVPVEIDGRSHPAGNLRPAVPTHLSVLLDQKVLRDIARAPHRKDRRNAVLLHGRNHRRRRQQLPRLEPLAGRFELPAPVRADSPPTQ